MPNTECFDTANFLSDRFIKRYFKEILCSSTLLVLYTFILFPKAVISNCDEAG